VGGGESGLGHANPRRAGDPGEALTMRYAEHSPCAKLAGYIACYWTLDGRSRAPELILPDGCMEMIANYEEPFEALSPRGVLEPQPQTFVVGQITRAMVVRPRGRAGVFGVRFRPGGARAFLPFPQQEIAGRVVSLDLVYPGERRELEDRLGSARSDQERVAAADAFLLPRCSETARIPAGLSARQYRRRFEQEVGLTPKAFERVRRLQRAIGTLSKGSLAEVAAEAGYYDQSHFIRDFREFSGMTPTEYLRYRRGEPCPFFPIQAGVGPGMVNL
jgi:AraC-like DNA-binding protein